jgi:hypothetical protein
MSDIFENVANKYRNTPSALVLFIAAICMLIIGSNHFAEDTYSSYAGLKSIEEHFHLQIQVFNWTYWTMSIAPQIAGVVFFYMYLANTDKKWALAVSVGSQFVDFLSDLWFRSNGAAFTNWNVTVVSAILTFAFFTVGSEMFVTFGAGLSIKLAPHALHSWKYYRHEIQRVKAQFKNGYQPQENRNSDRRENSGNDKNSSRFSPELMEKLGKTQEKSEKLHQNLHSVKSDRNRNGGWRG